jgi:glycosyltransferase involved in cell wall biosynthesis
MALHVLMCCNFYPPFFVGGAEIIVHAQAKAMIQAGHRVTVFCARHDEAYPHYSITEEIYDTVPVIRLYLNAANFALGHNFHNPEVDRQFTQVIDRINPDIIHLHNVAGLSLGMISVALARKIPAFLTVHDHWGFCFKNTRLKAGMEICQDFSDCVTCAEQLSDREGKFDHVWLRNDYLALQFSKLHGIISPSPYLAGAYISAGIPPEQMSVISNGVDVDRFLGLKQSGDRSPITFTFVGHLGFHKGLAILLEALEYLHQEHKLGDLCHFNIVGEGNWGIQFSNFIGRHQLDQAIKLWGKVDHDQVDRIYQQTDVLINCSIWPENEPVTILEAMAAGIPVVASDLGGNRNLIDDRINGRLYEATSAKALAQVVLEIIADPSVLKQWGEAAQQKMLDNTLQRYATKIIDRYNQPLAEISPANHNILACGGTLFSAMALEALDCWPQATGGDRQSIVDHRPRFVRASWLDEPDWDAVDLLWVVEEGVDWAIVRDAMARGKALIVPESRGDLVAICREKGCGLFYATPEEAYGCWVYLQQRPELLVTLGRNAKLACNDM